MTSVLVIHVYGMTYRLPVVVGGSRHHMAGKSFRKVKSVVSRFQNPKTVDAPAIARWPHPFDTAKQLKECPEAHVLVQEKNAVDQVAFDAFKASHPAEGEQGWWDNSQPFSREKPPQPQDHQEGPDQALKRSRSPPAAAKSEQRVPKKRVLTQSPQFGVVAAMLKKNM